MKPAYWRLGLDIGTNSIGWAVVEVKPDAKKPDRYTPVKLVDLGVRIFSDGRDEKSKSSLAVERREARGARRRRDRYLLRRSDLMSALVAMGLMPEDIDQRKALENLDPYTLRARALDAALHPHELGRALFHLHQRRGFKSNRKQGNAEEKGKILQATNRLDIKMAECNARTVGEYFHMLHEKREPVRARLKGQGTKAEYDVYASRHHYTAEFAAIKAVQQAYHPINWQELEEIIFRQRPLRPVEAGYCQYMPKQHRAPRAHLLWQRQRLAQTIANMKITEPEQGQRVLTPAEQVMLFDLLDKKEKMAFSSIIKQMKWPADTVINLETKKNQEMRGNSTNATLAGKKYFGAVWYQFPEDLQHSIVQQLLEANEDESLRHWLQHHIPAHYGVSEESIDNVLHARLEDGYGSLSLAAIEAIWEDIRPKLDRPMMRYDEACRAVFGHHSDFRDGLVVDELPYYGELLHEKIGTGNFNEQYKHNPEIYYGRFPNPTVHIALNQLRRVVNELIKRYGAPSEIHLELARELKKNRKQLAEIEKAQKINQDLNDRLAADLKGSKTAVTSDSLIRLKLFEELKKGGFAPLCVYSNKVINQEMALSDQCEIDHILPWSKTLDDSLANKILCLRGSNRQKRGRAPCEAYSGEQYEQIQKRAEHLPDNKKWRFAPDAMKRFEEENSFLDRQLTDTQYASKIARYYMGALLGDYTKVVAVAGQLTAKLRGQWGFNRLFRNHNQPETEKARKNRHDHRHHAIDALVVALTSRAYLQEAAKLAGRNELNNERVFEDFPQPLEGVYEQAQQLLQSMIVSHRLDHGMEGQLHEESNYGILHDNPLRPQEKENGFTLVYRKPLEGITEKEMSQIRDVNIREALQQRWQQQLQQGITGKKEDAWKALLKAFAANPEIPGIQPVDENGCGGIRRIRLLKKEQEFIPIQEKNSSIPYKALTAGENYCIDLYENLSNSKWEGFGVSRFAAAQSMKNGQKTPKIEQKSGYQFIMRLRKGDLLQINYQGSQTVMQIKNLDISSNRIKLVAHQESGSFQKRHDDKDDSFRWFMPSFSTLKQAEARPVYVSPIGQLHLTTSQKAA